MWMRACVVVVALATTAGCTWFHHGSTKCREPAMKTGIQNGAPLKLPAGLDAPDSRGAVRVPELNEPEQPRGKRDPCLSMPPAYKTGQP
ncbi:MAG: hypothetical protein U1F06_02375 [Steroidobacteraceae bacterium]